ncbi:MAG: hypothetical protein ACP5KG_12630 [Myxococcota bacterium]
MHTTVSILIVLIVSIVATLFLSRLIHLIEHSVKFTPIILLIILIYTILKYYHIPALIFILIFGLILNNIGNFKNTRIRKILDIDKISEELEKFKNIIFEVTFLIRSFFFILFGYSLKIYDIIDFNSILISILCIALIYGLRYLHLTLFRLPINELWYVASRGLITILLFISIPGMYRLSFINSAVIVQVIVFTIVILTVGNVRHKTLSHTASNYKSDVD